MEMFDLSALRRLPKLTKLAVVKLGPLFPLAAHLFIPPDVLGRLSDGFECTWAVLCFDKREAEKGRDERIRERQERRVSENAKRWTTGGGGEDGARVRTQAELAKVLGACDPGLSCASVDLGASMPADVDQCGLPMGSFFDFARIDAFRGLEDLSVVGAEGFGEPVQLAFPLGAMQRLRVLTLGRSFVRFSLPIEADSDRAWHEGPASLPPSSGDGVAVHCGRRPCAA